MWRYMITSCCQVRFEERSLLVIVKAHLLYFLFLVCFTKDLPRDRVQKDVADIEADAYLAYGAIPTAARLITYAE